MVKKRNVSIQYYGHDISLYGLFLCRKRGTIGIFASRFSKIGTIDNYENRCSTTVPLGTAGGAWSTILSSIWLQFIQYLKEGLG